MTYVSKSFQDKIFIFCMLQVLCTVNSIKKTRGCQLIRVKRYKYFPELRKADYRSKLMTTTVDCRVCKFGKNSKKCLIGETIFFAEIGQVGFQKVCLFVLIRFSLLTFSLKMHLKRVKLKKVMTFILSKIFDQKSCFLNFTLIGCIFLLSHVYLVGISVKERIF